MLKRGIEPRRRKSLLPYEEKSATNRQSAMFRYVYLGDRCMSRIGSKTVKLNTPWLSLDCGLWRPRTGCAKYLNASSKRNVCLYCSQKSPPPPPPPPQNNLQREKTFQSPGCPDSTSLWTGLWSSGELGRGKSENRETESLFTGYDSNEWYIF